MSEIKPRIVIEVPTGGLPERAVLDALGLAHDQVRLLYGDEIAGPRDYHWFRTTYYFTVEGVQRLAAIFGIEVTVTAFVPTVAAASSVEHKQPLPWWQKDLEETP